MENEDWQRAFQIHSYRTFDTLDWKVASSSSGSDTEVEPSFLIFLIATCNALLFAANLAL